MSLLAPLTLPAGASAAPAVTVIGTEGRDALRISHGLGNDGSFAIFPAAQTAATGEITCEQALDLTTGRPVATLCEKWFFEQGGDTNLILDLRGGDDLIEIKVYTGGQINGLTVLGGSGNDVLQVNGMGARSGRSGNGTATLDGGAGIDTADYSAAGLEPAQLSNGNPARAGGVTASLTDKRATVLLDDQGRSDAPTERERDPLIRTDNLSSIERLIGTPRGDILTGSSGPDTLDGGLGPDNLMGLDGPDILLGGEGADVLDGGRRGDVLDGGAGNDVFGTGGEGDTFLARDGFLEKLSCLRGDVIVDDLVDQVNSPANCASISTAQAKDLIDTYFASDRLRVSERGVVSVPLECPFDKPEPCVGTLSLHRRLGGKALASADYEIVPSHTRRVRLRLSKAEARRVRGKNVTLEAHEFDPDGRERTLVQRVALR